MKCAHPRQRGAVLVEFTLAFVVFWVVMIGVVDFARTVLTWNAAQEVTRLAARYASICDSDDGQQSTIRNHLELLLMTTGNADIGDRSDWLVFEYLPDGCNTAPSANGSCQQVRVRLNDVRVSLLLATLPGFPADVPVPDNSVTVMRETMRKKLSNSPLDENDTCLLSP